MNIADLLVNSSLFFIVFLLCGILARSVYRRRVVEPHRREVKAWRDHSGFQFRNLITYSEKFAELKNENFRLKQNLAIAYDSCDRLTREKNGWMKGALHHRSEVANLQRRLEAACGVNRILLSLCNSKKVPISKR